MKTKNILLILVLANVLPGLLVAQSLGWDNNRIAISADGNNQADNLHKWSRADPDDWGATPAALAILAKLELQDKLVHYSYNNFMASPPHTTETNEMKLGVDGGILYWNFDASRFFDVPEDQEAALNHLAAELAKSSEADPLYFIHMGPAEFFYRAVEKVVEDDKASALSNVYVISHSGYNDNHLRRGDPDFDLEPVAAEDKHHTMSEAIALSGERIKYTKIKDQNAGTQPTVLWKSDTDWTVWYWMRDHSDPSIQWIYQRMLANAKNSADISDAGMVYYLLVGDEDGSPSKFKTFIGDGINGGVVQPTCEDITWVGINDFEIAQIDTFVTPYKDTGRNAIAINAGAYKNRYAATQKVFDGVSSYYDITLTSLTEEDGESTYRVRVNGEVVGEFQNPETEADMQPYTFTFEKVLVQTGDVIQIESNTHSNGKIPEGDAYAFARGRWRSISFNCVDAAECDVEERDGLLVFEAERMELKGQWKLGVDADKASGGEYVYFDGPNAYTAVNMDNVISYTFKIKNPGNYTVKWTMRQPEGERGTDKGNDVWIYLSDNIGWGGTQQLTHYEKFYSRSGDDFILHGVAEVHGLGHKWLTAKFPTAGEYTINIGGRSHGLQIDRIVMYKGMTFDEADLKIRQISETTACGGVIPSVQEKVSINSFPSILPNKQTEFSVDLSYTALESRDILVSILKPDGTVYETKTSTITEGTGTSTVSFVISEPLEIATGYKVTVELLPLGGNSEDALASNESGFSVVDGAAPADKDDAVYVDVPSKLPQNQLSVPIKVSYSATQARDVNIEVKKEVYITNSLVTVPAGYGDTTIVINFPSELDVYDNYRFILAIRPVGGNWKTNITKVESNFAVYSTVSISKVSNDSFNAYPNPFIDQINFANTGEVKAFEVLDMGGRLLHAGVAQDGLNTLLLSQLEKGVYLLNLNLDDRSQKVIKINKQ